MESILSTSQHYPLNQIYFYLTEGCNLACRHCWLAPRFDPSLKNTTFLPVELYKQVITEAIPLGLRGVKLTGGEPFLHPRFEELLAITRQEELSLTIETNGVLCTPKIAQKIAEFPHRFVSVSLDGADAATHEAIRGVPGSFEKTCHAVKILVEADVRPQIIFSVMRVNAHQVEMAIDLAEKLGAESIKFNVIQPTERGEHLSKQNNALSINEYISLSHKVDIRLTRVNRINVFFDLPMVFHSIHRLVNGNNGHCDILGILGVLPDGQYALCGIGELLPELVFGRIGIDNLIEIWKDTPILNELRQGLPQKLNGICQRCIVKEICLGSCIAQNMYSSHNLWAPYWFCKEAERIGLFPSSRLK